MKVSEENKASVCNVAAVEPFDRDKYDNNQQDNAETKVSNLEKEINFYRENIAKRNRELNKLYRNLRVAERELKRAKELKRAEEIVALLKANAGKRVVISLGINAVGVEKLFLVNAEEVQLILNKHNCWVIEVEGQFASALELVEEIYVLGYGKE